LEPGGGFFIKGKEPSTALQQHGEILARLEQLSRQLDDLRLRPSP
jgi:hypothetical protein